MADDMNSDILDVVASYDMKKIKIATICSHSALQIFAGAREEGFGTVGICTSDRVDTYKAFPHACPDEFLIVEKYADILDDDFQDKLIADNVVIVPHGSFVEYVGPKNILEKLRVPVFGNKSVLEWEGDRKKERMWLSLNAGLDMPRVFSSPDDINCLSIVKYDGAKGGSGYFTVLKPSQYYAQIDERGITDESGVTIQEYVVGVRYYMHYFYSPFSTEGYPCDNGALELMGIDRRDESNIDELHRLMMDGEDLKANGISADFTVTGNVGCVLRESLLPKILEMAKKAVVSSKDLFSPGIYGPFCLETVVTPNLDVKVFEISARIVAGTNVYTSESPYTHLFYGKPMSCGRRIALEIKTAISKNKLEMILS